MAHAKSSDKLASVEAEMAYLGSLIFDCTKVAETATGMKRGMFTVPAHQIIFEAIIGLVARGVSVDLVLLNEETRKSGVAEAIGGADYLLELVNGVPNADSARHYADKVRELWQRRLIRAFLAEASKEVDKLEREFDPMGVINRAIVAVGESQGNDALIFLQDMVDEALRQKRDESRPTVTRIGKIDGNINLFAPGEMTIIAARPSVGKSSLMRQMVENAATSGTVLVFSMEVTAMTLTQQLLCEFAGVPFADWRAKRTTQEQDDRIALEGAREELANIAVHNRTNVSALEVSLAISRLQAQQKPVVAVFIDYLGLMRHDKSERHDLAVGSTTRMLKQIAIERKVPIVLLCQLNREVERHGADGRPRLAHLRDSGNIEQDADNVIFLWRKSEEDQYKLVEPRALTVAKHRNGECFEIDLMFNKPHGRFYEVGANGVEIKKTGHAPPNPEWMSQ